MRTSMSVVIAFAAAASGCKSKAAEPATVGSGSGSTIAKAGSGSGSGSAPIATGPCFPTEFEGVLKSFTADDKAATFCVNLIDMSGGTTAPNVKCMAVDLASGAYAEAKAPPAAPASITYKQDDTAVQACATDGTCVKLDLPRLPKKEGEDPQQTYAIHASADGKKLLATGQQLKGVAVLDATTGKKTKLIPLGDGQSECLEEAYFTGDVIYAITSVCAGPGGTGYLFGADGKRIAKIDTEAVNVYGSAPVQVDGDQWAFEDFGGGTFTVWNVKAGKEVRTVKIERLEDCDNCSMLGGESMQTTPLVKTPGGKMVAINGTGVTVADPKTGKVEKTAKMPMCAAKAP